MLRSPAEEDPARLRFSDNSRACLQPLVPAGCYGRIVDGGARLPPKSDSSRVCRSGREEMWGNAPYKLLVAILHA
jgi:hypothetical protein